MSSVNCKVVLLGKSNTGKTCLFKRYLHGQFIDGVVTIGGCFGAQKEQVGNKGVILGIWDTAGSEKYISINRMYYRRAKAAIICYDITDRTSLVEARFWAQELNKMEENCKIYLCGTKKDLVDSNPHSRDVDINMARDLGKDLNADVFETSSKTGDLFQKIAMNSVKAENTIEESTKDAIRLSCTHDSRIQPTHKKERCCSV